MADQPHVIGAKGAILLGPYLLVTRRDDRADILCPNMWDFPGGGREGDEDPFTTLIRETREEVGLDLTGHSPLWARLFPSAHVAGAYTWFYIVQLPLSDLSRIRMCDEGQGWRLVKPAAFAQMPDMIGYLRERFFLWNGMDGLAAAPSTSP